jgi:hypothetical protein
VLYLLFVVVLGFMATTYRRFRDMERQLTLLTRGLSLDEARIERPDADASRDSASDRA